MDDLRKKLARVETEISSKRDERKAAADAADEAREAFAQVDGYDTDSDEFRAAESAVAALDTADAELDALEASRVGILRMLSQNEPTVIERNPQAPVGGEWDASKVIDTDAYRRLAAVASSKAQFGSVTLGEVASRDAMAAAFKSGDAAGLIQPDRRGLVQPIYRPLSLLDVFPTGTTNSNLIQYVQVTKLPEESAEISEGNVKPEVSIAFEDADAPVRTIAGWIKLNKQALADADGLRSFVDTSLRYDVNARLENQIIVGDGSGDNLTGLLETSNTLEPSVSGSNADRVHQGITAVKLANLAPSVVILNPLDMELIRLSRDDSGAQAGTGGYLFGPPSQAGASTLWGLRTVESVVCPEGTAIVCDPSGAIVLIREGTNILVSDSDQDDFVRNRVTVLGECRAALVVQRPDAFAIVDLSSSG